MSQESINPKIKAVISIRKAVQGIADQSDQMREIAKQLDVGVEHALSFFMDHTGAESHELYLETIDRHKKSVLELKSILNLVIDLINERQSRDLTSTWDKHITHSNEVKSCLNSMFQLGISNLQESHSLKWAEQWQRIFDEYNEIETISDSCKISLALIESCAPEEIDGFTQTLLKHIPLNYSIDEAEQYEKEYLTAYQELKQQANQKKNLWDRILDILAGGAHTTPAQMVVMNRWVNGEKGDL
ncbi:MAG: hypothetical protein ABJF11_18390 [Reichenbachiella sp.]|uniref:hypothetical protein n=1 Tax=Reichenbachiella sp. TaxID=2184521 RepID=UPI003262D441